jgi:predicted PurR-regulated permease PerM
MKHLKAPRWITLPTTAIITLLIVFGISMLLLNSLSELVSQKDYIIRQLNAKIISFAAWLESISGGRIGKDISLDSIMGDYSWVSAGLGSVAQTISSFAGSFVMFAIYYIIFLTSLSEYKSFLSNVVGEGKLGTVLPIFDKIQRTIVSYVTLKTLINLTIGGITYIICLLFGLKFAFFAGFITFLLFFIPTIGSIIAPIVIFLLAVIQYDNFNTVIFLFLCITVPNSIMANVVEPMFVGNRMKLYTLTVIFGIVYWGYVWGIAGMVLCVPLIVVFKAIVEEIPSVMIIGRILGPKIKEKPNG